MCLLEVSGRAARPTPCGCWTATSITNAKRQGAATDLESLPQSLHTHHTGADEAAGVVARGRHVPAKPHGRETRLTQTRISALRTSELGQRGAHTVWTNMAGTHGTMTVHRRHTALARVYCISDSVEHIYSIHTDLHIRNPFTSQFDLA